MYFTTTPALMSLERTMQQVPNFPPHGGGKYFSRNKYTKKDCDCRLCPHYKKHQCTLEVCPVLEIRLECGAATINDAVIAVFGKAKHLPLRKRIERIYMRKESEVMKFRNKMHQAIFETSKSKQHKMSSRAVAVLYLLTADNKLWNCAKHHIDGNGKVNFEKVRVQDLSTDAYALWKAVRELQICGQEITLSELADAELISDKAFRLIVQAVTVSHYGEVALTETEISR